jgi:hypothetical protein
MAAAAERSVNENAARLRIQPGNYFSNQNRNVPRPRHDE